MHQPPYSFVEKNTKGTDFIVGDIHGHYKAIVEALRSVYFNPATDRLFCVRDLVDRGQDSLKVLNLFKQDWFYSVAGNHDQFILKYCNAPEHLPVGVDENFLTKESVRRLHEFNGGSWFYKLSEQQKIEVKNLVDLMPLAITLETEYGDFGIVHAEVPEDYQGWDEMIVSLGDDKLEHDILWGRKEIFGCYDYKSDYFMEPENQIKRYVDDVIATVHGHTSIKQVVVCGNQIWIDTLLKTGELTLLSIHELAGMITEQGNPENEK